MDLFDAIAQRHSYRGRFRDVPVPREDLCRIVQAGLAAPSGCNQQTTTFVIVDDPDILGKIAEWVDKQVVRDAKAMIVCVVEHRSVYRDLTFAVEDCSAAVENMLLAVTALGYASVWIDGWLRTGDRARKIGRLLGVPDHLQVRVMLPVGVPAETRGHPPKKPFDQRAWFNRYVANPQGA